MKVESPRAVYRPGLIRVLLLVAVAALFASLGVAVVVASPFSAWSWIGIGVTVVAVLIGANLVGMRIEVDNDALTKFYLFGLRRSSIPIDRLRASRDRSSKSGGAVDFEGSNGAAVGFGVSPAVWRRRDIEALYSLAAKTEYASSARYELKPNGRVKEFMIDPRHAYPVLLDGESGQTVGHCKAGGSKSDYWIEPDFDPGFPHKEIGFFAILHTDEAGLRHLKEVVLVTPTGSAGDDERRFALPSIARDPDPDHYDLELGRFKESFQLDTDITCAVRLGSASGPRLGECRVGDLSGDAWVEPHFTLPVPRDEARFYAAWNIDSDGLRHLTEVILATKGAKPPSVKPVGRELGDTETGWMLMFSIVGFIELIIGSAIAIGQNGRNWPANVGAGALGYVVFSAYSFLATRVPMKPALLRLVPTVSMAVAIALPVAIWVVVNGLPCPPKCA